MLGVAISWGKVAAEVGQPKQLLLLHTSGAEAESATALGNAAGGYHQPPPPVSSAGAVIVQNERVGVSLKNNP